MEIIAAESMISLPVADDRLNPGALGENFSQASIFRGAFGRPAQIDRRDDT